MQYQIGPAIQILERTPVALRAMLSGLDAEWTATNEGENSWTPHEVVAHLIHAERDDWIPRLRHLLTFGDARPFPPFDPAGGFAELRSWPLGGLLDEFARLRASGIATLREFRLTDDDLDRRGLHPAFGPVTLRQHLATWTVHDLTHVSQIVRVMAAQYRDAVGPWRAYLRIVR